VVEVQLQLVGRGGDGLTARELEDINQVLVGDLGELAALIRVEVDVVDVEGGRGKAGLGDTVADGVRVRARGVVPAEIVEDVELKVDADLVVLEGDQGQGQTRVAAEPELERDVEGGGRGAVDLLVGGVGLPTGAVIVARLATLDEQIGQNGDVANHLGVASLFAGLLGELVPDVQPDAIVLVNALATDFELDTLDQIVANPVEPAELGTRAIGCEQSHTGESGLEVDAVD